NHKAAADHRRKFGRPAGIAQGCAGRLVARRHVSEKAAYAGLGGACQQDGAHGLGAAYQGGRLQGSGTGRGVKPELASEVAGRRRRSKESMAKRSARPGRKTREWQSDLRARKADMDPIREHPYGPAAVRSLKRPDRWQHPTTLILECTPWLLWGRPQLIWIRSANSHTGPQQGAASRGRTDGSTRLLNRPGIAGGP